MEVRYEKHWSGHLNREMEFKIYGSSGKPVLFIPCQAGRFVDFEGFNMDKTWAPWIESGEVMVFACDSIDNEAWAALGADKRWRIENHEKWFNYITTELVPAINYHSGRKDIITFGASMGGIRVMRRLATDHGLGLFGVYCWGLALFIFILNLVV